MEHTYDVIIIGAGQAGTAMRKQLKQGGVENHLMIDAQKHIGESWRLPYNSLVLFTPKSYSSLPGLEMKGDPNSYPKKNEMADYLEVYVAHFKLPYQLDTMVTKAEKQKSHFNIHTLHETIQSRNVVVACGAFQKPYVPPVVWNADAISQVHSSQYTEPPTIYSGTVLIVGGGNSGAQIAVELSATNREVILSISHLLKFLPLQLLAAEISPFVRWNEHS